MVSESVAEITLIAIYKNKSVVDIWFAEQCGYRLDELLLGPKLERAGLKTRLA